MLSVACLILADSVWFSSGFTFALFPQLDVEKPKDQGVGFPSAWNDPTESEEHELPESPRVAIQGLLTLHIIVAIHFSFWLKNET